MDSNRRNLLIRKRGIVKAAITRIQRHVDAFQQGSNMNIIRVSLEQLSNTYAQYTEVQDELELEDIDEEHTSDREEFEEKRLSCAFLRASLSTMSNWITFSVFIICFRHSVVKHTFWSTMCR